MSDDPFDGQPLNEYIVDEWMRTKAALDDLIQRHEKIVNHLADVCRRNDKMQSAGNRMRDVLLDNFGADPPDPLAVCDEAIQKWTEANT